MKNKAIRKSNFELLRIVAMMLIVTFHIAKHGNIVGQYKTIPISVNKVWIYILRAFGKLGVNIFVLISGYFLITKDKVKISRIIKLWLQIVFYCIGIYLLFVLLGKEPFHIRRFLITLIPISSGEWWFATSYFVLYLISPFINMFLKKLSKTNYKKLLILTTIIWCVIPTFIYTNLGCSDVLWFVYLYSVAAYIHLYKDDLVVNKGKCLLIIFGLLILSLGICLGVSYLRASHSSLDKYVFRMYEMQSIPEVVMAILIFMIFKNINIKYNKIINIISSTTFGIYLMHDHDFIRLFLWRDFFKVKDFAYKPILIPYTLGIAVAVFIGLGIVDLIRMYLLEKNYMKLIDKVEPKLEAKKEKIFKKLNKLF